MRQINIEWKHFDQGGKTCDRCGKTGLNLKSAIEEIQREFEDKNLDIQLRETKLAEKEMNMSNILFINGMAIEDILGGISVFENTCNSCGELTGNPCCCRAIRSNDVVYEEIPKETIKKAILKCLD